MSRTQKPITVSREELYAQVWKTPVDRLAETYGISGRGLGKLCERMNIPVPPRGYWARVAAGQKVVQYKLPPLKEGELHEIAIVPTPEAEPPPPLPKAVEIAVQAQKSADQEVPIAKTLSNPHPIVQRWIDTNKRERTQWGGSTWSPKEPRIDGTPLGKRRLLILSALFKELERRKYTAHASTTYPREIYAEIQRQKVVFELEEYIRQVRQPLTPAETAKSYNGKQKWTQIREPTGKLRLRITAPYGFHGYEVQWLDDEQTKIEDHLAAIMTSLIAVGAMLAESARIKAEEDAKRHAEEHKRYEREQARKRDDARWKHVLTMVTARNEVRDAVALLDELEKGERERLAPAELPEDTVKWLEWARDRVHAENPLNYALSDVIKVNKAVNEYSYSDARVGTFQVAGNQPYPFWLRHR